MGHGYNTVFGYGILLNIKDIIIHLIKKAEGISNEKDENNIDIDDYEIDVSAILNEFEEYHSKEFNFHYEGQDEPTDVFITLYRKEYCFDARGACGSHCEINLNKITPTDDELKMFEQIQIKMIGKTKFLPTLSAFSYETS